MAKNKTTIKLWLREDRKLNDGTCPIHLIYQIQGQRKYIALPNTHIVEAYWDNKAQRVKFLDKKAVKASGIETQHQLTAFEVAEKNDIIETAIRAIETIEKRFRLNQEPFTVDMVIGELKNVQSGETTKTETGDRIYDFIQRFVEDSRATKKAGTLKVYTGLAEHLAEFEKEHREPVTFQNLTIPTLTAFHAFLVAPKAKRNGTNGKAMNNITAAKQISTLKTVIKAARTLYKLKVNDDYKDFKIRRKDSDFEVITLTQEEFLALFNMDLSDNKKLDAVRDVFCFSCATGLRYSDLKQLKREHIRGGAIKMTAAKTSQRLDIPLNPYSSTILAKYQERLDPLPVISNQKTNDYLKELCKKASIDTPIERIREYGVKKVSTIYKKHELVSIHTGRKTFTTLSLEKGMAPQEVMSLTGHTSYRSFARYVDVTNERKKTVMAKAWGELPNPLKKAE